MIDWRHWHNEPYLVGGLVLLGWLWAILAGPLRPRLTQRAGLPAETPFPRGHAWRFYSALFIFYLAVGSPLDQIGERFLFSAHMLQHQLLVYPAAILFLLGIPSWMADAIFHRRASVPSGPGIPAAPRALRLLFNPVICGIVYTLVISLWHRPDLYDLALRNKAVHVLEHLMFFGAALLYWWPMLSPSRALPPISHAAQMLYFVGVLIAMTPLFAYLTFSQEILYPTYEYAPRVIADFSPADDQLLAGVSMKLVGVFVALGAVAVSFFRWYQTGALRDTPAGARP